MPATLPSPFAALELDWSMERDAVDTGRSYALLAALTELCKSEALSLATSNPHLSRSLKSLALRAHRHTGMEIYADGGVSAKAFWDGGDTLFEDFRLAYAMSDP